jgi:hypothetical protein
MKKLIALMIIGFMIKSNAQQLIAHQSNSRTTTGHITTINHPATNGKSDLILIVSQQLAKDHSGNDVYNDNEIGVWYNGGKWKIFNQNRKPIPDNAKFNVFALPKTNNTAFIHTTMASNTIGHITTLNSPLTNDKPEALVFVTQNFGHYNTSSVGVWYNGGKWKIYNEDTSKPMPIGTKFNVVVVNPRSNRFGNLNLYAFKWKNYNRTNTNFIRTSFPLNENDNLFVTQNYIDTYNPNPIGVKFEDNKWGIFSQNKATMLKGVQFNVLSTKFERQQTQSTSQKKCVDIAAISFERILKDKIGRNLKINLDKDYGLIELLDQKKEFSLGTYHVNKPYKDWDYEVKNVASNDVRISKGYMDNKHQFTIEIGFEEDGAEIKGYCYGCAGRDDERAPDIEWDNPRLFIKLVPEVLNGNISFSSSVTVSTDFSVNSYGKFFLPSFTVYFRDMMRRTVRNQLTSIFNTPEVKKIFNDALKSNFGDLAIKDIKSIDMSNTDYIRFCN